MHTVVPATQCATGQAETHSSATFPATHQRPSVLAVEMGGSVSLVVYALDTKMPVLSTSWAAVRTLHGRQMLVHRSVTD